jgi:polyisoprenoid-binding protein YceI
MKASGFRTSLIASLLAVVAISANAKIGHPQPAGQFGDGIKAERPTRNAEEADYKLSPSKDVVMNLSGTTPIKNWSMSAHGLNGDARIAVARGNRLTEIHSLNFSLPVLNLKGEQHAMDEDAYTALKADTYKDIVFKLSSATVEPQSDGFYTIEALGKLTVAGVTKTVTLKMRSQVAKDGSITFTGSENVKMSDYNVERPSHFFGIIKADDNMILSYTLIFTK